MVLLRKATDEKWILNKESLSSKSSIKNCSRHLLQQMLVIQSLPPTWKWWIWKGHGCHPVCLLTYHPVQPHNTLVLRTWSFGQPNQCKCSNLETQKRYKLWPFHRQRAPTLKLKLNFLQEPTGDLFFTSTQSPSGEPSWSNADIIKILIKTVWPNILLRLISVAAQVRCERN